MRDLGPGHVKVTAHNHDWESYKANLDSHCLISTLINQRIKELLDGPTTIRNHLVNQWPIGPGHGKATAQDHDQKAYEANSSSHSLISTLIIQRIERLI